MDSDTGAREGPKPMTERLDALTTAWISLSAEWRETHCQWRDAKAIEFESRFWREIEEQTRNLISTASRLDETMAQASRNS